MFNLLYFSQIINVIKKWIKLQTLQEIVWFIKVDIQEKHIKSNKTMEKLE